jgi:Pathogenicity locus
MAERQGHELVQLLTAMEIHPDARVARLEDLPNIGKSIAGDLRSLGILSPADLARRTPLDVFLELATVTGERHDPCLFYTLLAAGHFLKTAESVPWWKFTQEGKRILRENP